MAYQSTSSDYNGTSWAVHAGETALSFMAGALFGAGLMYLFDPDRGRTRRATVRDKSTSYVRGARESAVSKAQDLKNRAAGMATESRRWFEASHTDESNEILVQRVRSEMGNWVADPQAVDVLADQGCVTLRGQVLSREAAELPEKVRMVKGVRNVDSQLTVTGNFAQGTTF